jgi:hypothetical protein
MVDPVAVAIAAPDMRDQSRLYVVAAGQRGEAAARQAVAEAGEGTAHQQRFLLPVALQEAGCVQAARPVQFERSCGHVRPLIGCPCRALQSARTPARDR